MKTKKINKEKVKKILVGLQDLDVKKITDKNNNLNVEKLNKLPKVVKAVEKLNKLGVTRKWLIRNFNIAGLLLHSLKN